MHTMNEKKFNDNENDTFVLFRLHTSHCATRSYTHTSTHRHYSTGEGGYKMNDKKIGETENLRRGAPGSRKTNVK